MRPKLIERVDDGKFIGYYFYCPGCKHAHLFEVPRWTFNGNLEKPTFSPSLRVFYTHPETKRDVTVCHLFIKEGMIEFCADSPHDLKGQTVTMADWPDGYAVGGTVS